jgi:hypothetical protein
VRGVGVRTWTFATGQDVALHVLEIETARALEGGFSGGPVVNARGELVGVTIAAQDEKSLRVYCADAGEVRRQLAESYCTLAQKAILTGDDCTAGALLAKARRLAPDHELVACLDTLAACLGNTRSPLGAVLRTARWIFRESMRGVHP